MTKGGACMKQTPQTKQKKQQYILKKNKKTKEQKQQYIRKNKETTIYLELRSFLLNRFI